MEKSPEQEDEQPETNARASTPQLDRLEKLANASCHRCAGEAVARTQEWH